MTDRSEIRDKQSLIATTRAERSGFDALIASLDERTLTREGVIDGLSVKDVVAHIGAWERRIVAAAEAAGRGETPAWPEPGWTMDRMDELNDRDFAADRARPLLAVLADARMSYERASRLVDGLDERDLFDSERFAWTRGEPLWRFFDANMGEHYAEHRAQIEAWVAERGAQ
jgi:hypothetical protein